MGARALYALSLDCTHTASRQWRNIMLYFVMQMHVNELLGTFDHMPSQEELDRLYRSSLGVYVIVGRGVNVIEEYAAF
jgi:hypothetical protein